MSINESLKKYLEVEVEEEINENDAMKKKYLPLAKKALAAFNAYGEIIAQLSEAADAEGKDSDMAQYLDQMEVTLFNEDVVAQLEEMIEVIEEGE